MEVTIEISEETAAALAKLGKSDAVQGDVKAVLKYVACSLADGVRRSGSWEATLLPSLFGRWGDELDREDHGRWGNR